MAEERCLTCKSNRNTCSICGKKANIVLNITDACNEYCKFCWHANKHTFKQNNMSESIIDDTIKFLKRDFGYLYPSIMFMGGEPTLNMDIIEYAVGEFTRQFDRYYFSMVTNAVDVPDKLIDVLKNNPNFRVNVSLPRESSQIFNKRLENVKRYIELSKMHNIVFLITIQEEDFENLHSILKFWKSIGITRISVLFEYKENDYGFNEVKYSKALKESIEEFKYMHNDEFAIENFIHAPTDEYFLDKVIKRSQLRLAVFADGSLYLTTRDRFFNNSSLGSIYDGIDMNEYINLLKAVPCYKCKYNKECCYDISAFFSNNKLHNNKTICISQRIFIDLKNGVK